MRSAVASSVVVVIVGVASCARGVAPSGPAPEPALEPVAREVPELPPPSMACYTGRLETDDGQSIAVAMRRTVEPHRSRIVEVRAYGSAAVHARDVLIYQIDQQRFELVQGNGKRLGSGYLYGPAWSWNKLAVEIEIRGRVASSRIVIDPPRYRHSAGYSMEILWVQPCDQVVLRFPAPPTW
jgi:hypothetical protein